MEQKFVNVIFKNEFLNYAVDINNMMKNVLGTDQYCAFFIRANKYQRHLFMVVTDAGERVFLEIQNDFIEAEKPCYIALNKEKMKEVIKSVELELTKGVQYHSCAETFLKDNYGEMYSVGLGYADHCMKDQQWNLKYKQNAYMFTISNIDEIKHMAQHLNDKDDKIRFDFNYEHFTIGNGVNFNNIKLTTCQHAIGTIVGDNIRAFLSKNVTHILTGYNEAFMEVRDYEYEFMNEYKLYKWYEIRQNNNRTYIVVHKLPEIMYNQYDIYNLRTNDQIDYFKFVFYNIDLTKLRDDKKRKDKVVKLKFDFDRHICTCLYEDKEFDKTYDVAKSYGNLNHINEYKLIFNADDFYEFFSYIQGKDGCFTQARYHLGSGCVYLRSLRREALLKTL